MLNELRWEGIVRFVDIENIVEHHCFEMFRKWLHDYHDFPYDNMVQGVVEAVDFWPET
jgi:hypothetical protein